RRYLQTEFAKLFARGLALVDPVFFLDEALGRQPVIIKAHGIENVAAAHALVTHDEFRLRVRHGVPHMQMRSRHIRWGRVYRKHLTRTVRIIEVDAVLVPEFAAGFFHLRGINIFWKCSVVDDHSKFWVLPGRQQVSAYFSADHVPNPMPFLSFAG